MNTLSSNIFSYIARFGLFLLVFLIPLISSAKCGGVDYSQGADALSDATDFLVLRQCMLLRYAMPLQQLLSLFQPFRFI